MALYAIGDLHLSLGTDKPMDVFGGAWKNYLQKLERGLSCIGPADTTVLLGDIELGDESGDGDGGFCVSCQHPGPEDHPQGQPRLLVGHGGKISALLPGARLCRSASAQ